MELATLGGGCFWCLDAFFRTLSGVQNVISGYAGGAASNPTYKAVCSGNTGHAEVIHIEFDPAQISYESLLHVFFAMHDPTTLNRQGYDVGTQYRSIILVHSPEQETIAHSVIQQLNHEEFGATPIVTQVVPFTTFYAAETEHQDFWNNNQNHPYCQRVIAPKLSKLQTMLGNDLLT